MALLRKIIDGYEKQILQRISTIQNEQKKQLEDYKSPLRIQLEDVNVKKATFELLITSKNYTKLLQTKQAFDNYVNKMKTALGSLPLPTRAEYILEDLNQVETFKKNIIQCSRYIEAPPYDYPDLVKFLSNNRKKELDLVNAQLDNLDMKIVATFLRENTVDQIVLYNYSFFTCE